MPQNFYLVMKGAKQGDVVGSQHHKTKTGSIDFLQVYLGHKVLPGVRTDTIFGTPKPKPFTIVRKTGPASPSLFQSAVTGNHSLQIPILGFGSKSSGSSSSGSGSGSGSGLGSSPQFPTNIGKKTDQASTSLFQAALTGSQSSRMPNLGLGSNPSQNSNQGSGSGSGSHPPVTIRRPIDSSSTQLFQALNNNEVLGSVTIQYQGAGGLVYALDLTNAVIMSIERVLDPAVQGPCEDVEFSYSAKQIRLIRNELHV